MEGLRLRRRAGLLLALAPAGPHLVHHRHGDADLLAFFDGGRLGDGRRFALGPLLESWRPPPGPELLSARALTLELALELAPDRPPPRDEATIREFLRRVARALRSLATMAVELQRIWADERNYLGIRSPPDGLGLLDLSAAELIERMVDPEENPDRIDLQRATLSDFDATLDDLHTAAAVHALQDMRDPTTKGQRQDTRPHIIIDERLVHDTCSGFG